VRTTVVLMVLLALCGHVLAASEGAYVWWEGEDAYEHNFSNRAFAPRSLDHPDGLSGGDWLNNGGKRGPEEVFARWRIDVPVEATYRLYARKFWHHGPFRWRFDDDPWQELRRVALIDDVPLRLHVTATWSFVGEVDLTAGPHEFEVRLLAGRGENAVGAFDCFALTRGPWVPSGKLKPGEKTRRAMPGFWAFEPDTDTFAESPMDLRRLNHTVAGEKGFLRREGASLVFTDEGRPVRFWGVCAGANAVELDPASVDYLARKLAKAGVNLVRLHSGIFDRSAADPATVDMEYLRKLHYFVYALKQQGIYTALSIYFPLWFDVKPHYGLPGYQKTGNKKPFSLLFFHPRMQEIYRSWAHSLMTTPNPYTGVPLADDPAVAIYEIANEDNYFFWTFTPGQNIPFESLQVLEAEFGSWASAKYGSPGDALKHWQFGLDRDDAAQGRLGLLPVWNLTRQGLQRQSRARRRAQDQARFLTEQHRDFYEAMVEWLRGSVGVKCPIVATNWAVADADTLGALDKYVNATCDVMDRHGYWGPPHVTDRTYTLTVGDRYRDQCGLLVPQKLPVREIQYFGHPHMISEYSFPMINRYRGDSVFLAATYGALQGTDAYCFFAVGGPGWRRSLRKWPVMVPSVLGQFPAAALIYRRGDVPDGDVVVRQVLNLESLYRLEGGGSTGPQNVDDMRAVDAGSRSPAGPLIDPLAYYVGRVVRELGSVPRIERADELGSCIDREARTVSSADGLLALDWGQGVATLNAARAQGATGFLARAGEITLDSVTIRSGNEYGCLLVTSLDDAPISASQHLLVQVMSEETTFGWEAEPAGDLLEVTSLGSAPLNVKKMSGQVTIRRPDAGDLRVTALDANGYPLDRIVRCSTSAGRLDITLEPDILYYHVSVSP